MKETQALESLQNPDARIISAASAPLFSSSPATFMILALALSGSLLIGGLAGLVRETLAAILYTPEDVIGLLGVAAVAASRMPVSTAATVCERDIAG